MSETAGSRERVYEGIAVSPGIARGPAIVHWVEEEEIPYRKIAPRAIPEEIARFEAALISTRAELLEMQQRIAEAIGTTDASIFDAHLLIVEDRTLIDEVLRSVESDKHNVEFAFHKVAEKYCRSLSEIDDPYLRERVIDIEDVTRRVIRHLLGKSAPGLHAHTEPHIIVGHNLTPSDTALLNRSLVLGFATEAGSKTSHTAIMARSLNIPAIVGLHDILKHVTVGDPLLIDGYRGILIAHPSPKTLEEYDAYEKEKNLVEEKLELIRDTSSTTTDSIHITLSANIELPDEMDSVAENGAEGVGLYRTEYLFLNRDTLPDEEEQFQSYRTVAERSAPYSVIIRTLDLGGDKVSTSLNLPNEENPFLGCRAIRFCLEHTSIFKTQLRAVLRASAHGHVRIMYPMISGLTELRQANALLEECKGELRSEGQGFDENLDVGVMIEIPSAALAADILAKEVKFFSIGTNDLIQYTIAVDRVNDRIAHLYKPTHPAVLRLIRMVVEAARTNNIWTGVCGEMAGEIVLTPLLLGIGIDELSTSATLVPRVKKAVQSVSLTECQQLAEEALRAQSSSDVMKICEDFARARYDELVN